MTVEQVTTGQLIGWIDRFRDLVAEHQEELTALDAAIGDADHGSNLARGTAAVAAKLTETPPTTVGEFGKTVGMALVSSVGGASGPLFGTFFLRFGASGGSLTALTGAELVAALRAGLDGVVSRGKAAAGDKTMLDALIPALAAAERELEENPVDGIATVMHAATKAATAGRDATEPLVARKGRASYLGERSAGHLDPGAVSAALMLDALEAAVA